jgi:DNA-binding NarL/FixJ family response regulator
MIRVLIADDQALIRAGFAALINSAADLKVVGEAIDGADALRQCATLTPNVVLMDIRMPELDGLQATEQISANPDLDGVHVLILTTFEADEYVVAALRAGAGGFLGKGVEPTELLDAVRVVAAGDALLSPRATRALIDRFLAQPSEVLLTTSPAALEVLTDREREIVAMVGQGLRNDQIAEKLYLSPLTAKTHVNRAMSKLGARDRAQLVVIAYQSGLVRAGDA